MHGGGVGLKTHTSTLLKQTPIPSFLLVKIRGIEVSSGSETILRLIECRVTLSSGSRREPDDPEPLSSIINIERL